MNSNKEVKIGLAMPTYNANKNNDFEEILAKIILQQGFIDKIKIYDSESTDETISIAKKMKIEFEIIEKSKFSHSGTRTQICEEMYEEGIDFLFFMTQDVFLQEFAIENAINFIIGKSCALVYGKQEVDLEKGDFFELCSRSFNYGDEDMIKDKNDSDRLGIKTIFCSDAFAIYNLKKIKSVGYFGNKANFAEDMLIASKLVENGEQIGYCSKAKVFHTHHYTILDEYKRYILIGKFQEEYKHELRKYHSLNREGMKLVVNEIIFLTRNMKFNLIFSSLVRNFSKFLGIKIGKIQYSYRRNEAK